MTAAGTSVELNGPERLHAATAPSALDGWTGIQLTVVGLCFVVNMIDGMDVLLMSYIAPTLQEEWAIGADELGVVFSISVLGMAIGGIGLAPLADFLGRRRLCLAALATSTFAMLASGFVVNVPQLMALRFLVGVGVGTVLASMAALVADTATSRSVCSMPVTRSARFSRASSPPERFLPSAGRRPWSAPAASPRRCSSPFGQCCPSRCSF